MNTESGVDGVGECFRKSTEEQFIVRLRFKEEKNATHNSEAMHVEQSSQDCPPISIHSGQGSGAIQIRKSSQTCRSPSGSIHGSIRSLKTREWRVGVLPQEILPRAEVNAINFRGKCKFGGDTSKHSECCRQIKESGKHQEKGFQ